MPLVRPGQNVGHHIQAPGNVSGFQCYVIVMAPGHDVPQEEHTSLLSELLVCLSRLPLLSCPLQLVLFGSGTGP